MNLTKMRKQLERARPYPEITADQIHAGSIHFDYGQYRGDAVERMRDLGWAAWQRPAAGVHMNRNGIYVSNHDAGIAMDLRHGHIHAGDLTSAKFSEGGLENRFPTLESKIQALRDLGFDSWERIIADMNAAPGRHRGRDPWYIRAWRRLVHDLRWS